MPRLFPKALSLGPLLVLIGAVGYGGARWGMGRRELLHMAQQHDVMAQVQTRMAAELEPIAGREREQSRALDPHRDSSGKAAAPEHDDQRASAKLKAEDHRQEFESIDRVVVQFRDSARWHVDRAKELRATLVFNLAAERLRDDEHADRFWTSHFQFRSEHLKAQIAARERSASAEDAAAERLAERSPDSGGSPADDAEIQQRIRDHRRLAEAFRRKAEKSRGDLAALKQEDAKMRLQPAR